MRINRPRHYGSFMWRRSSPWEAFRPAALLALAMLMVPLMAGMARAEPIRIVGLGDSLMAGYQLGPGEGFAPVLERELTALGYEVEVIDAGVSGDTTTGGLGRLEWSVPEKAEIVIVELGGNDALRGIDPAITRSNLDAILDGLKLRGQRPVLAGMLAPPNMGADYEAQFNSIYTELARSRDVPLYPFFLEGVITDPALMLDDGIHPNANGVEAMVTGFIPTILPVIEAVAAERGGEGAIVPGPSATPPSDPATPAARES